MSLQKTVVPPRNARISVHIPITHLQMVEKMFGVVGSIMKGIFIFKATIHGHEISLPGHSQPLSSSSSSSSPPPPQTLPPPPPPADLRWSALPVGPSSSHKRKQAEAPPTQACSSPTLHEHQPKQMKRDSSVADEVDHSYDAPLVQWQDQQRFHFAIPVANFPIRPNTTLQPLLLPLETMEQDLELLMESRNPIPFNVYMMFKLWILGERAECYWCMGLSRESLETSLCFLEVSKRSTKNFISHFVSIQPILELVLNILLSLRQFDIFQQLLDAILEPLDTSIPHVARSKARYLALLFAANPIFSFSTDIDTDTDTDTNTYTNTSPSDGLVSTNGGSSNLVRSALDNRRDTTIHR